MNAPVPSPAGGPAGLRVLVVGAATGAIAGAIAAGLAKRGASVIGSGRSASRESVQIDVTDGESVHAGIATAAQRLGGLDAVINGTGVTAQTPSLETPLDEWNRVLAVNLTGAFLVAQAAARVMSSDTGENARGGSIVLISSLCAQVGCDSVAAYSAAKAGLSGLARTLASEWGPLGIRVNTITPGVFLTPLTTDRVNGTQRGANSRFRTPLGRFGDVSELLGAVELLAGPDGSFITGADITVDGGFLASGIHQRVIAENDQNKEVTP